MLMEDDIYENTTAGRNLVEARLEDFIDFYTHLLGMVVTGRTTNSGPQQFGREKRP